MQCILSSPELSHWHCQVQQAHDDQVHQVQDLDDQVHRAHDDQVQAARCSHLQPTLAHVM